MAIRGFRDTSIPRGPAVSLDASQAAVVRLPDAASALVVGAPGSGKTTVLAEVAADRVHARGWGPHEVLALTTSRSTATQLRDRLASRLAVASPGPMARTVNSLAFEIVQHAARAAGADEPRLITGGEQDSDIAALLAGQLEGDGDGGWPDPLGPHVRMLRGFRTELRELMMRATEYGIVPDELAGLGASLGHPEWAAAAGFMRDYLAAVAQARPGQLDSAELVQFAVRALAGDDIGQTAAGVRLVLIDDVHEASASTIALLRAFAARGVAVIAFGDPDVATSAFRGAEPDLLGRLGTVLGLGAMRRLTLAVVHRHGAALRSLVGAVTERIGTAGVVGHRGAPGAGSGGAAGRPEHPVDSAPVGSGPVETAPIDPVLILHASTPARQYASLARHLRELHLIHGIGFGRMAVIVRSGAQVPPVARALARADVATTNSAAAVPLRDDRAAHALLTLVDVGCGRTALTAQTATELLLGPFGGLDRLSLRRLRLALRTEELAGGGNRPADDLLVEALCATGRLATIDHRVARQAQRLAEILARVRTLGESGGSIEELLWSAWQTSGLAEALLAQSQTTGVVAAEANRDLDGIVALFTAAKRFVERQPGTPAPVFLEATLDAEVPEDTLSPRPTAESVLVTTPSGAVGIEVDVVVVAGLQDGGWPNLRPRGSLLHPAELVRVVTGSADARLDERKQVLDDELRMFALAVSRARRQVVLTAVSNEDEAASVFFALAPNGTPQLGATALPPLSLRGLVGRMRRELTGARASDAARSAAASGLAQLAAGGVPGADPAQWLGLLEPSSTAPLYAPDEPVPVSPSKLDQFEKSPLDWFVDDIAGGTGSTAMGIGTIVHWAMETAGEASFDAVWHAIEERWPELLFEAAWLGERQRAATRVLAQGVADYLRDRERAGVRLVGAERRFELPVGRAELRGSVDRLERSPNGEVAIVDLKTGRPITRRDEIQAHPQLGAYQLAYADGVFDDALAPFGEHTPGGAKLLFVREGIGGKTYREAVQEALDADELEAFRERIRAAAAGMAEDHFTGTAEVSGWTMGDESDLRLRRVREVSDE